MDKQTFINKLEKIFDKQYNSSQVETLEQNLRGINPIAFEKALRTLPMKYSTLPTIKNAVDACRAVEVPVVVQSKNALKPEQLDLSKRIFNAWFAPLQIKQQADKLYIKPPLCKDTNLENYGKPNMFFEYHIMSELKSHLLKAASGDVLEVIWCYGESRKTYSNVDNFTKPVRCG